MSKHLCNLNLYHPFVLKLPPSNWKVLVTSRCQRTREVPNLSFNILKTFVHALRGLDPFLVLRGDLSHRFDNEYEVHKTLIMICQSQKCTKPRHINGYQDFLQNIYLCLLNSKSLGTILCPKYGRRSWKNLPFPWWRCNLHFCNSSNIARKCFTCSFGMSLTIIASSM